MRTFNLKSLASNVFSEAFQEIKMKHITLQKNILW